VQKASDTGLGSGGTAAGDSELNPPHYRPWSFGCGPNMGVHGSPVKRRGAGPHGAAQPG